MILFILLMMLLIFAVFALDIFSGSDKHVDEIIDQYCRLECKGYKHS